MPLRNIFIGGMRPTRQEEKTELTRERILQAAMREFGTNGYAATKVNTICCKYGIPKGLL